MFTSLYFYRVPKNKSDKFLEIQRRAGELYRKHGAIDDWTFGPQDLTGKYGCQSFLDEFSVGADESLFFSLSLFRSKEDHDRIMALIDGDSEIDSLNNQICETIDIAKVIRGEFNRLA